MCVLVCIYNSQHLCPFYTNKMCLAYNIDDNINEGIPCCATSSPNADECIDREASERKCPLGYSNNDSRSDASNAVQEMLGGEL